MQSRRQSVQFRVLPDDKIVEASHGESVLDAVLKAKIPLNHSCGGFGTCTTCRIFVEQGLADLPERNELELERASERSFLETERLACQIEPRAGLIIRRPT